MAVTIIIYFFDLPKIPILGIKWADYFSLGSGI